MEEGLTIRPATLADREALLDIWLRSVRTSHSFLTEEDIQSLLPIVRDVALAELDIRVLCSLGGTPVGFLGMSGSKMEALFLAPEFQRRGGGRLLVEHARERHRELTVDVNEQNPEARRFYEACGFVVEGRSQLDGTGRPFPLLHMRWRREAPADPVRPNLGYRDAAGAMRFLEAAFGFEKVAVYEVPGGSIGHAEMRWPGGGIVTLHTAEPGGCSVESLAGLASAEGGYPALSIHIDTEDPDALFARAVAAGARIVREPADSPFGTRGFIVRDPEGLTWSFGTPLPKLVRDADGRWRPEPVHPDAAGNPREASSR